jgi:hypothetical protein
MEELYDLLNKERSSVFIKPTFPTKRWGQTHLKYSTTDKKIIEKGIDKLKENNVICRKIIDKESMIKYPKLGKFYKIELCKEKI